jgi:hypothetical protein
MPIFVIEAVELHLQKYRVEAPTAAEAIDALYQGDATKDGESEFIDLSNVHGLPIDENQALADAVCKFGHRLDNDIIDGVSDITEL